MKYYMKYGSDEYENLTPYEREILIGMFIDQKEKEEKEQNRQQR